MGDVHNTDVIRVAPWQISAHWTSEEAILESVVANEIVKINSLEKVVGQRIVEVRSNDRLMCCGVADGHVLCFASDKDGIGVAILHSFDASSVNAASLKPIRLQANDHTWTWDRAVIAGAMLGCSVTKLFFTKGEVYLYLSRDRIISVSPMQVIPSGEPLVYWDLSD